MHSVSPFVLGLQFLPFFLRVLVTICLFLPLPLSFPTSMTASTLAAFGFHSSSSLALAHAPWIGLHFIAGHENRKASGARQPCNHSKRLTMYPGGHLWALLLVVGKITDANAFHLILWEAHLAKGWLEICLPRAYTVVGSLNQHCKAKIMHGQNFFWQESLEMPISKGFHS